MTWQDERARRIRQETEARACNLKQVADWILDLVPRLPETERETAEIHADTAYLAAEALRTLAIDCDAAGALLRGNVMRMHVRRCGGDAA